MSDTILAALVGLAGVFVGGCIAYFATLAAQHRSMVDHNLSSALMDMFRSYKSYVKSEKETAFSDLLISMDCVRLFCSNEILDLLEKITVCLASDDSAKKEVPKLFRKLVNLSRDQIQHQGKKKQFKKKQNK